MENHIIIRATADGGKTTTCGMLYEKLSEGARFAQLYNYQFEKVDKLIYNDEENLVDFIAVIILKNGKVIVIVSQGDVAKDLKAVLEKLADKNIIRLLTDNQSNKIDIYILCGRSQMRTNSAIEMLYDRIPEEQRRDFWTDWSENIKDRETVKLEVVENIIKHIEKV